MNNLLNDIEQKARAATPGPWNATDHGWPQITQTSHITRDVWVIAQLGNHYGMNSGTKVDEDAAHIATMDSSTTLRLVAALRECLSSLKKLEHVFGYPSSTYNAEAKQTLAKVQELLGGESKELGAPK